MNTTDTTTDRARPGAPVPAIRLNNVVKSFGDVHAVTGIDLTIQPGEIVAFLGPNGAGKTTTIDMIMGLSQPTEGSVEVHGMSPREAVGHGLVSAVMQTGGLLKDLTVRETVAYVASLFPYAESVDRALERAGIAHLANRKVGKCSGGEQQRLRFALALLPDPSLIILDEPTTGMDVGARREFWAAIREDAQEGRTVLFATHYLEEADQFADRVILVRQGQIVADGTSSQVKAQAAGRVVRATVTDPQNPVLQRIPGATGIDVRGHTVVIHGNDTDAIARFLLTSTDAHDLEITTNGLEDAFLTLTTGATK